MSDPMKCPRCGAELLLAEARGGFCQACRDSFPPEELRAASGPAAPTHRVVRSERLARLVKGLPSTLALVIDEYNREANDYQALQFMCGALEITARFLTTVALAEVWTRRASDRTDFPEQLVKQLLQHLERPTLGSWRVMLTEAIAALPGKAGHKECLLAELPAYVEVFANALGGSSGDPLTKLLPTRNLVAHGGRISEEMVKKLLAAHDDRFEELMHGLRFLSTDAAVALVASPSSGPARILRGVSGSGDEFDRARLPEGFRQAGPDRMLLVTPGGVLDLCPLHAHGEIFQIVRDQLQGQGEEAIHIYSRAAESAGADYTTLGSRASHSRGARSWEERFAQIYRLEAWRACFRIEGALARYTFQERMDQLLQLFIGRSEQAAAAAARIETLDGGVLWLAGKPGMGKSAFMAKLVRDHFQRDAETGEPRTDVACVPYFFQTSDGDRCRTPAFAEAAILRLAQASGQNITPENDPQKRLDQFKHLLREFAAAGGASGRRKIVILADGIDEVMAVDQSLVPLIFECRHSGVVWVCAGRDEESLRQQFHRDHCEWFFERGSQFKALRVENAMDEGLLPSLKDDDVRAFFIEELGHRLPQFFGRDTMKGDKWSNEYVEEVIRRSDGLPLYLKLLVSDIRKDPDAFAPGREQRLPRGLEEYYDRIVDEMGDDLKATMPAVTTLLALAYEPLPLETLLVLLADHELVGQEDGRELLEEALRHSSVMLRRALTSTGILGYTLYHESFRQHFRVSDRVRRSCTKAGQRLANMTVRWEQHERGSAAFDYVLRYGPRHLCELGRLDELTALLNSPFLTAKTERLGPLAAYSDCVRGTRAAAHTCDDRNLVLCLKSGGTVKRAAEVNWQRGKWLLGLLNEDALLIGDMARVFGGEKMPWTAFLAAERLFDLGQPEAALKLLAVAANEAWPDYKPPTASLGMAEGTAWDFLPRSEGLVEFLAMVASQDVRLALQLSSRLYPERRGVLPNTKTGWREVIRKLKVKKLSPSFYRNLLDTTNKWFEGTPIAGARLMVMELFDVLLCALPEADPNWVANSVLSCTEIRFGASSNTLDGICWACADLLEVILRLGESCGDRPELRKILVKCVKRLTRQLPHIKPPTKGEYNSNRSEVWARLAQFLERVGDRKWRGFAEAALVACEKDGGLNDPPIGAVHAALSLLTQFPRARVKRRAAEVAQRLPFIRAAENERSGAEGRLTPDADAVSPRQQLLERLSKERDVYQRGQIVLELNRLRLADNDEIARYFGSASADQEAGEKPGLGDGEETIRFEDALAEALILLLAKCNNATALDLIQSLDKGRAPERQEHIAINHYEIRKSFYRSSLNSGHDHQSIRDELEGLAARAVAERDVNELLSCALLAVAIDPELADRFYRLMPSDLDDLDRAIVGVTLIEHLSHHHPARLSDLGEKWLKSMPTYDPSDGIAEFQLALLRQWGSQNVFRSVIVEQIRSITRGLPNPLIDPGVIEENDAEGERWGLVGAVLDAVGHVSLAPDDGSESAVMELIELTRSKLREIAEPERRSAIRALLEQIKYEIRPALIAHYLIELFEQSREGERDSSLGDGISTELALNLAICLRPADPEWADDIASRAREFWRTLLAREAAPKEFLEQFSAGLLDAFTRVGGKFRNHRESTVWDMTSALVRWGVQLDTQHAFITELENIAQDIRDIDLRQLVLAPIAFGYLASHDFQHARQLLERLDTRQLEWAGFYEMLASITRSGGLVSDVLQSYKGLCLDALLAAPTTSEAFCDALTAWLGLRFTELRAGEPQEKFVEAMVQLHRSLIGPRPSGSPLPSLG